MHKSGIDGSASMYICTYVSSGALFISIYKYIVLQGDGWQMAEGN